MRAKKTLVCATLAAMLVVSAQADFIVPSYVFHLSGLDEAKREARTRGKALAFVLTDPDTRCPKAQRASMDAFRILSDKCVLVLIEVDEYRMAPPRVRRAMRSSKAGRYIPKTVVTTADLSEVICVVRYASTGTRRRLLREAVEMTDEKLAESYSSQNVTPIGAILAAHDKLEPEDGRKANGTGGSQKPPVRRPTGRKARAAKKIVVSFGWPAGLVPGPDKKVEDWFERRGFVVKKMKSGSGSCSFEVQLEDVEPGVFTRKLEGFLKFYFGFEKEVSGSGLRYKLMER